MDESYRHDVMLSERSKTTREDICMIPLMRSSEMGQTHPSMVIEIRIVVTLENSDWKGTRGFQGGADVQFPNLGSIS